MDETSDKISNEESSVEDNSNKEEDEVRRKVSTIVANITTQCRNSVLASQILKALPEVTKIEKRGTLHAVLHQLSEEALVDSVGQPHTKRKYATFHIPKRSIYTGDNVMEEYNIPGKKNKLLTDSFVRNLPVPIQEKRLYKNSISFTFRRKPWYLKVHDFGVKKLSNIQSKLEFWHDTLKLIEGQHGAAMVSYFLFIRWLLYMNIIIFLLNFIFIVIPQTMLYETESHNTSHPIIYPAQNYLNLSKDTELLQDLNEEYYDEASRMERKYSRLLSLSSDYFVENITNASSIDEIVFHCRKLYVAHIANNSHAADPLTAIQNFLQGTELQKHQLTKTGLRTLFVQFLAPITITILNCISPIIFSLLVTFENYHGQTQVNLSLFRNIFLSLSSIMVLLNTIYQQITCKPKDICGAGLNWACRSPRCWETYIGQQLYRLTLTDLFAYIGLFLGHDVLRNYVTRNYNNRFTRFVGHLQFFLETEVLAPINSQTILWLGVFYSPLLPLIMILKLIIIFYIKKTKILKFCDPLEHTFQASRFNAVFIITLMISFFVVLIFQSFAIERIPPSRGCGPFRNYDFITSAFPESIRDVLSVLFSHLNIIFIFILLCVAIYYYQRIIISQRELAKRLKAHLVLQSQDKQFLLKKIAELTRGNSCKKKL